MAALSLKWLYFNYDLTQKGGFKFYGLIDSMYSVKLPSDNYLSLIQDGDIEDDGIQMACSLTVNIGVVAGCIGVTMAASVLRWSWRLVDCQQRLRWWLQ